MTTPRCTALLAAFALAFASLVSCGGSGASTATNATPSGAGSGTTVAGSGAPAGSGSPVAAIDAPPDAAYDYVAVDFVDSTHGWIVGADEENAVSALFRTTDGGGTWTKVASFDNDVLRDVDFTDEQTGWVAGDQGVIYASRDGGSSWAAEPEAQNWSVQHEGTQIRDLDKKSTVGLVSSEELATVFFVDAKTGWAAGDIPVGPNDPGKRRGIVLGTTDGGTTWKELVDASGKPTPYPINDIWFLTSKEGWAAAGSLEDSQLDVLLHTTDGGSTWTRQETGTAQYVRAVQFAGRSRGWVVGLTMDLDSGEFGPSKILATTDGGTTWTPQLVTSRSLFDVVFTDPLHGWAIGDRAAIYATTDSGATWKQQTNFVTAGAKSILRPSVAPGTQTRHFLALFVLDSSTMWVAGQRVVLRRK